MKSALALFLTALPAAAQVYAPFPPAPALKTAPALGARPAETRVPMSSALNLTWLTPVVAPLGDKDFRISLVPVRGEPGARVGTLDGLALIEAPAVPDTGWSVTALPVGGHRQELAGSWPFKALRKQPLDAELGGRSWKVSLVGDPDTAVNFAATDSPLGGLQVPVSVLKRALWDAAAPLPALGPEWRLAFCEDLWVGAGMRSVVFLRAGEGGTIEAFRTGAEALDDTRAVPRRVAGVTVTLVIDADGRLVLRRRD